MIQTAVTITDFQALTHCDANIMGPVEFQGTGTDSRSTNMLVLRPMLAPQHNALPTMQGKPSCQHPETLKVV
jgi:hypothetical protein